MRVLLALLTPQQFKDHRSSRLYGHLYDEYKRDPSRLKDALGHLDAPTCASLSRRLRWLTFEETRGAARLPLAAVRGGAGRAGGGASARPAELRHSRHG